MSLSPKNHKKAPLQRQDANSDLRTAMQMRISSSTDTDEEVIEVDNTDDADSEWEFIVREETKEWLAMHGAKLFALESSKFLATESKRKALKTTHR